MFCLDLSTMVAGLLVIEAARCDAPEPQIGNLQNEVYNDF